MRFLFVIVVLIHGMIHLLGFLKAYDIFQTEVLTIPISKSRGLLWLFTAGALALTGFLYLFRFDLWWVIALSTITVSQILIISAWTDARFGTIANIIILIIAVIAGAQWNFSRKAYEKVEALLIQDAKSAAVFEENQIEGLPVLSKWLELVGATNISGNVYLKQSAKMKLKPEANWQQAEAEQWFTTNAPGFVWYAKVGKGSLMSFTGRDSFLDGKGQMLIKIHGLIPIVNAENKAIDEGTAIRFLAESVWFPWIAKSNYVHWEVINNNELKATFNYQNLSVTGVFVFDNKGLPSKFETMRFNDQTGKKEKWVVEIKSYQDFDGLLLPSEAEVSWHLSEGKFTWYKLKVEHVEILNDDT